MATRPGVKRHTITDIVATVYCEQKAVFDRERGRIESRDVRAKREEGIAQHKRFEDEGRRSAGHQDRRCFIATAVYGQDAAETNFLRAWRDRALMPSRAGRVAVHLYYGVSPMLLPALERHAKLARVIRAMLDRLVRFLGMR